MNFYHSSSLLAFLFSCVLLFLPLHRTAHASESGGSTELGARASIPESRVAMADAEETGENEEEEDDDWETTGPIDRTVHLSGVLQASFRSTLYDEETLPGGGEIESEHTFQIEHTHLKFSGDLSEHVSWEIMPCVTHMNDFSVILANFSYRFDPRLQVTFGRFLLPFGQFNLRSLPGTYQTVSRPLLYQSHEDRMIRFDDATPSNFIFTPRDDTGLEASGNEWFGADDEFQLSYSAFLTNGLRAVSDQMSRFWDDNNNAKQVGGRLSLSYNGARLRATLGGSVISNKYETVEVTRPGDATTPETTQDQDLDQFVWGTDAVLSYQYRTARRVELRAEYVKMLRDIQPTDELLQGDEEIRGAYVTAVVDLNDWMSLFYQWDTLTQRTPKAQLNEEFRDLEITTNRHVGGLSFLIDDSLVLRLEYGRWLEPMGVPDAHRISVQTIVTF